MPQPMSVTALRAEYRRDSPWVGVATPRLSWKTVGDGTDWTQGSAEISWGNVTALVDGPSSVLVAWPFAPLRPRDRGQVRVRVTGSDGQTTEWSEPLEVRAGFVDDWQPTFVALAAPTEPAQPFRARLDFDVERPVVSATLHATARGAYQAFVNGTEVDDEILKPGWTSYQYRLIHETTDVTALVRAGQNTIAAEVAGGWYTETYALFGPGRTFYGDQAAFAATLVLEFDDGSTRVVETGEHWRVSSDGPIRASSIYRGESVDARREMAGWAAPLFDDLAWSTPSTLTHDAPVVARTAPPVRATEQLAVREVITSLSGRTLLDFGQNLVGRLRIMVEGPAGTTITLRHAEVLEHGELGVRPLRAASATDTLVLAGGGVEVFEPRFTFHGFRYAEVQGWPGEFDPSAVTAVVIHSDMERTGHFESSHALVNQLHENVVWGMRGNFLSLPTDCPQRDERLGWTGDVQVFTPTASFLFDCDGFLASWLEDLALEQAAVGSVPFVVPDPIGTANDPAAAWGDAATIVPSVLARRFGDRGVLETQFDSMRAWVDQCLAVAGDGHLWEGGFQFGDWLDPDAPPEQPGAAKVDTDIVASAYLFRSTVLLADAATELGRPEVADEYRAKAELVRVAWVAEYTTVAGRIVSDAVTAYALAIAFHIAPPALRAPMGERLALLVRRDGYRIGTGFVGTPLILEALSSTGHTAAASRLLRQTENPSWLYPVTMGATTIWERWDSMLEDGSINPGGMTSFNHYAFGAVAEWLQRCLAGLGGSDGYRTLTIEPTVVPGFDFARASLETPYGLASSGWSAAGGRVTVSVTVPANATAVVRLPDGVVVRVGSGQYEWETADTRDGVPASAVSADSMLADVMDDEDAYRATIDALASVDPGRAAAIRGMTRWLPGQSMRSGFFLASPEMIDAVDESLANLTILRQLSTDES